MGLGGEYGEKTKIMFFATFLASKAGGPEGRPPI